jgi:DNA polymerase-3 subunit epsilon
MILELVRPLVFLDLETTGLEVETDRIVEIGLVKFFPDGTRTSFVERVDPGIDIPENATRVHGIRTEEVRGLFGRPRLARIGAQITQFLGDSDLGGYNSIPFDLPLLLNEFRRHSIAWSPQDRYVVDSKLIFHAKETGWDRFLMGPRDLSAAVRTYCGREHCGAHTAGQDAAAAADVLFALLARYPDLPRDVRSLHEFCAGVLSAAPGS